MDPAKEFDSNRGHHVADPEYRIGTLNRTTDVDLVTATSEVDDTHIAPNYTPITLVTTDAASKTFIYGSYDMVGSVKHIIVSTAVNSAVATIIFKKCDGATATRGTGTLTFTVTFDGSAAASQSATISCVLLPSGNWAVLSACGWTDADICTIKWVAS